MEPTLCNTCTHITNVYRFKLDEFKSNLLIANPVIMSNISIIGRYLKSKQPLLSEMNQKPLQAFCVK